MLKRTGWAAAAIGLIASAWACWGRHGDFEGTWARVGLLDSSISLREAEDGFHFRWKLNDGDKLISCTRDDFCEEFRDGDRVYEYHFRLDGPPGSSEIIVRCDGRPVVSEMEPVSWVDRIVLHDGGRELWSYLVEMNGEKMEPPVGPIRFVRVAETPF